MGESEEVGSRTVTNLISARVEYVKRPELQWLEACATVSVGSGLTGNRAKCIYSQEA